MKFIHSVIAQDQAMVNSTVYTWDLPTNPLSHLIVTIKGLNKQAFECTKYEILSNISKIEVLYKGAAILSTDGVNLDTYNSLLLKNLPILLNQVAPILSARALTLVVPFGRKLMNPKECFHATMKGELKLQITTSAASANFTPFALQIETVELPEATPENYLRFTTLDKTPSATGLHDVDLPIGNKFVGIQLNATTVPIGTVWTKSISYVKLLANNVEYNYAKANWECLHGMLINKIGQREPYDLDADHDHYMTEALLDFDPIEGEDYLLDSAGLSSLKLRIYADIADAIKIQPIELVPVGM